MITAAAHALCTDNQLRDDRDFEHHRSDWRALLAQATVLALTTAHAFVVLAAGRRARRSTQPPHDSLLCICEECCARRHFIRRELAAEARRSGTTRAASTRHDRQVDHEQRDQAHRLRVVL